MKSDTTTIKLAIIGVVSVACFIASMLVMGLVSEREERHTEAEAEVSAVWGAPQTVMGPVLVFRQPPTVSNTSAGYSYVLPETLTIESTIEPEKRTRGIFETVVYAEQLRIRGTFSKEEIAKVPRTTEAPTLAVSVSDTRSIEKQVLLNWQGVEIPFEPGSGAVLLKESGIHATVPLAQSDAYAFSFDLPVKGSEKAMFVPVGKETAVTVSSPWPTPEFTGALLPTERNVTNSGFTASWQTSSFGRNYPQTFKDDGTVTNESLQNSAFGVNLYEGVGLYEQIFRTVKYAVLFIVVTFAAFFLFEVMAKVRLHPVHYFLVGSALALFYLLLLSLSEHIGFLKAYIVSTVMIATLITAYSSRILKKGRRALGIFTLLIALYGYLFFVLKLEDYALLFGSLLLFVLLGGVMYLTRNIDWFSARE